MLENCTLAPIWVRKMPKKEAEEIAMHFLKRVRISTSSVVRTAAKCLYISSRSRSLGT